MQIPTLRFRAVATEASSSRSDPSIEMDVVLCTQLHLQSPSLGRWCLHTLPIFRLTNVTIGRIEVRVAPAQPSPRRQRSEPPKPMSLDQYLQRRGAQR